MPRFFRFTLFCAVLVVVGYSTADAQAPVSLGFQGYLTDLGGEPHDATVSIQFKIYKGGTQVWTETQPAVVVSGGVFDVALGRIVPIDTLAFSEPLDLGIAIDGNPEISPRTSLAATAFALGVRGFYAYNRDKRPLGGGQLATNVVAGTWNNEIDSDATGGTISGGGAFSSGGANWNNRVTGDFGTVGGGFRNLAAFASTVGGGDSNTATTAYATVGGGLQNSASNSYATVGGGRVNQALGFYSTVAGGHLNVASGDSSTVGGGRANMAGPGMSSTVAGGVLNQATGNWAFAAGGKENAARGGASFAAGFRAKANHPGSFVWKGLAGIPADSDTSATTNDAQFLIDAGGGVGIGTNTPQADVHIENRAVTGLSPATLFEEEQVIEDTDAILGLYSSNRGTYGSGIVLGEHVQIGESSSFTKWAMVRETTSANGYLRFTCGSNFSYGLNDTQMRIQR